MDYLREFCMNSGSTEGVGLELLDEQTVAEVVAFRLWGTWGRRVLVQLARGVGGRERSSAPGRAPRGILADLRGPSGVLARTRSRSSAS